MKFGLSDEQLKLLLNIFSLYPEIKQVKVFGSRALGNYRANSDIDLVLYGNIDTLLLGRIAGELEELPLPYLFDVKVYSELEDSPLQEHIDAYAKVIYPI